MVLFGELREKDVGFFFNPEEEIKVHVGDE